MYIIQSIFIINIFYYKYNLNIYIYNCVKVKKAYNIYIYIYIMKTFCRSYILYVICYIDTINIYIIILKTELY